MIAQPDVPISNRFATPADSEAVHLKITLELYTYPKPDREAVKLLVIGSERAVTAIVNDLHQRRFAETFEWTDFLPAPNADRPLRFLPGEVMKALVKYMPKQTVK